MDKNPPVKASPAPLTSTIFLSSIGGTGNSSTVFEFVLAKITGFCPCVIITNRSCLYFLGILGLLYLVFGSFEISLATSLGSFV